MNEPLEAVTGRPAGAGVQALTTRVFLALAPPDDAKDELAQVLRPAYDAYPRMRWNRIEDWHITLAFLGELPVAAVPPLMPPLAAFAARDGRCGWRCTAAAFDERVLWTGVTGDLDGLHRLAVDVRTLVREWCLLPERPLRPHLTLARSRRGDHANTVEASASLAAFAGREWEAGRLHLVGSNIGRVRGRSTTATSRPGTPSGGPRPAEGCGS
ncbi:RNA 2',3'-cyclic phosphodiesterase [Streptomyces sp. S063]|uniref:RNA 2',3'-cyclic phosphodiesterase n=1 Tax=Streptomyces sp. S063 TaxID=2005885 RepID=UPI001F0113B6|nr:RNA 2',3'-cyclic phosphodiesterase [Streptomyces sp. S063]